MKTSINTSLRFSLWFVLPIALQAQVTWDGGGASQNWSDGDNWVGDTAPTSGTSTQLVFTGSVNTGTSGTPLNQDIGTPMDIDSLQILQPSGTEFYLGGGDLRITPDDPTTGIYRQGQNSSYIDNNIIFGADARVQIEDTGSARHLFFTGTVDLGNNSIGLLSNSNSRRIRFENTVSGSGGFLFQSSLDFDATNTFSGGLELASTTFDADIFVRANDALGTGLTKLIARGFVDIRSGSESVILSNDFEIGSDNASGFDARTVTFQGDITVTGDFRLGGINSGSVADKRMTLEGSDTVLTLAGVIEDADPGTPRDFSPMYGDGTVVVTNANNTYAGATLVGISGSGNAVTLIVDGNISSSSGATVEQDATLRGLGTTSGIDVNDGGLLAPGHENTIGTLTAEGNVVLNEGASLGILLGATAGESSLLDITNGGGITLDETGSGVSLLLSGTLHGAYTIAIFADTGGIPYGTFSEVLLNGSSVDWDNSGYSVIYGDTYIQLIPEPKTAAALLGLTSLSLVLLRRRRR